MGSTPAPSVQAYLDLVPSQYRTAKNYNAWLAANLQLFLDVWNCANSFNAALDLSQAIGAQLDMLGVILGQSRTVSFQPSDSVSPVLDDDTYRILLQAQVLRYHWNGLLSGLHTIWNSLFPGGGYMLVNDGQNMTCAIYLAAGGLTSILQDLISHDLILPRPQGILFTYSFGALPLFGYDQNSPTIGGWDRGKLA